MAETKVIMPQMGESIFEGTITRWLKKEGDHVERDEPLFEISTDKIDSEIPAPEAGTLKTILVGEDETVEINTVVALISTTVESGEGDSGAVADRSGSAAQPGGAAPTGSAARKKASRETEPSSPPSSPVVRRLAAQHDVDLQALRDKGTGAGGRITKRDILSYIEQQNEGSVEAQPETREPASGSAEDTETERRPMTPMRRAIAEHMVASRKTSAHVATVFEADCSAIFRARSELRTRFGEAGVDLTFSPFFIHAAARALRKFPLLNSSVEGDEIVLKKSIHIGMAVAIDDGLLVPVIRHTDRKDLEALARSVADLAGRARGKKLRPEEVQGGTFTVTNPGPFGGLYGIPIINQPQVAILAIGGIEKRPVVVDDAIAIRPMVYLTLSFDHRVIDGAVADQFMAEVKRSLETWSA